MDTWSAEHAGPEAPFFSVCIPQYNRTSFLLKSFETFSRQTFRDFEVCLSDGGSTDGRHQEVVKFLEGSSLFFRYRRHERNLPYDPNLRASMALARGRYCLLFGNDDMLASDTALGTLHDQVLRHGCPEVVIPNFRQCGTGEQVRRMPITGILGAGAAVALANFRNFSFVSGILLLRTAAERHATDRWDGSEMYQMYLGCRMLAEGGRLLGIDCALVLKDIQVPGEQVDSYARRPVVRGWRIEERRLPLGQFAQVAFDAIAPFVDPAQRQRCARSIFRQTLIFTYPPWLIEYRRVQSWPYALGVALGMRPRNLLDAVPAEVGTRLYVSWLYVLATAAGLLMPRALFQRLRPRLYAFAKRRA